MKHTGVTARGIITPIFKQGDNLAGGVAAAVLAAADAEGFAVESGDIIGVTESVLARTQGNYASCGQIAADAKAKFGGGPLGVVFPIMSRNRFSILLKAFSQASERLVVQLSYPGDEVGNALISADQLEEAGINPYTDSFTEQQFREKFGADTKHPFTGIDYIEYYKSLGDNIEIVFSNNPAHILTYAQNVLCADIHTRRRTKRILQAAGAGSVLAMDDLLTASVEGSGYNEDFGLLGSNMAGEDCVKLFPREAEKAVQAIQAEVQRLTGKTVEVLIYGDGCFKDPVGGIWEFADPVVSPAFTRRLAGTPNEIKIKYFADTELADLSGEELAQAMRSRIREKDESLVAKAASLGTTPRRYTDLVGSLCDLVSGSGDRGTPVVYIKGYFDNFAS